MVSIDFREGISETIEILKNMEKVYVDKISNSFMNFLENNKFENYKSNIDYSKNLNEIKLKEKTKNILAVIYMNYWCTNEEKLEYQKLLIKNERKYQEKLREKYNPDNIFKNN